MRHSPFKSFFSFEKLIPSLSSLFFAVKKRSFVINFFVSFQTSWSFLAPVCRNKFQSFSISTRTETSQSRWRMKVFLHCDLLYLKTIDVLFVELNLSDLANFNRAFKDWTSKQSDLRMRMAQQGFFSGFIINLNFTVFINLTSHLAPNTKEEKKSFGCC